MTRERLLILLLRLCAVCLLVALVPAFMPFSWMMTIHRAIGLGELSETPLNQHLTRSLSAVYALQGALMLVVSFDVRRYWPIIRFLGWANVLLGAFLLALDHFAGLPLFWILSEGPSVIATGLLILWLTHGGAENR